MKNALTTETMHDLLIADTNRSRAKEFRFQNGKAKLTLCELDELSLEYDNFLKYKKLKGGVR